LLTRPLLYLSLYLKTHRSEYFDRLTAVRERGDWEGWLAFFLEGVAMAADEAVATARHLYRVVESARDRVLASDDATLLSLRLFEQLPEHPIITVNHAMDLLGCSRPAAGKAVNVLESAGVLGLLGERKKNRLFVFEDYVEHLRKGTD
jgi:Fic family protein